MLFLFSLDGAARIWLEKEPPRSILTWEDIVSKFVNHFFPPSKTTNFKNDITNFQQRFDESFGEAWDRFKDLLRKCPHHGFLELHHIDTLYNVLTHSDQDSLKSVARGNLLNRTPRDALTIIENKSKIVKELVLMNKDTQQATVKAIEETCVTCGGPHPYYECLATGGNTFDACAVVGTYNLGGNGYRPQGDLNYRASNQMGPTGFPPPNVQNNQNYNQNCPSGSGSLPSDTVAKPIGDEKAITTRSGVTYEGPSIPPNFSSLPKEVKRELEITKDKRCSLKSCSENLETPASFSLCDFPELEECLALADLGASINLMPLFVWKKLSFSELTPTRMTLELANWTKQALIDVYGEELTLRVSDEAITFKAEHTSRYSRNYYDELVNQINVIDVACEEYAQEVLGLLDSSRSGNPTLLDPIIASFSPSFTPFKGNPSPNLPPMKNEDLKHVDVTMTKPSIEEPPKLELKDLPSHLEYAFLEGSDKLSFIISKELKDEEKAALLNVPKSYKQAIAWKIFDIKGIDPRFCTHKILMEDDFKPVVQHQRRVNPKIHKDIFRFLSTRKTKKRPPSLALMGCLPTDACLSADVILRASSKDKMLKWCKDTNLVLNWEKCHFMVKEGIVLRHKISNSGIEVGRAKVDVIAKPPHSTSVKGV
nr:hypothetical protein [Tanacetum cinerariifolium]